MGIAYEMARASIQLRNKIADEVIANKIIELTKAGERNPDLLCEETLNCFQQHS
jgi:hypothetical protein